MNGLAKLWHPERYQGVRNPKAYFEGWYFKLVDRSGDHIMAVIPGVSYCKAKGDSHAFIQIIDGIQCKSCYLKYDIQAFTTSGKGFEIRIGENIFSSELIHLNIDRDDVRLNGTVRFSSMNPWPVTLLSPGIMGWFAYVPFMECYHGIVSLKHNLQGSLSIDGSSISFDDGFGYAEKDWGKSFPSSWIWIQSNHFEDPTVWLTASVAKIPWLRKSFTGFIIGVSVRGRLYRFATYTGAHLEALLIDERTVQICLSDKKHSLVIHVTRSKAGKLLSPKMGVMANPIEESATAVVHIKLSDEKSRIIFEGMGKNSGLEVMGDMGELRSK